ncbi:MAG: hypothetical protein IKU98_01720 [Bacteroidaceae bacterium]|nr:hypothetical protein [Bacteroidaceae bacterium]
MTETMTCPHPECPNPEGCEKKNLWWKILLAILTALAGVFGITSCI